MTKPSDRKDFIAKIPVDSHGVNDPMLIEAYPHHVRLIGLIICAWSEIEYKLIGLLAIDLKVPMETIGMMVYAVESSGARLEILRAAFARLHKDETKRTEMIALIEEAQSLLLQRNKFAHSLYGHSEFGEMAIVSIRKDLAADLPLHDLKHQFERMRNLNFRVGREWSLRAGTYQEQPSAQHASDVRRLVESNSHVARIDPSPPDPPKPFRQ